MSWLREHLLNERGDNRKVGITWGQRIGNEECPYMRRWVFNVGPGSIRVHHWTASDDPRATHDHPWWFLTCVVRGGYTDISQADGWLDTDDGSRHEDHLHPGSVRFRRALHAHTVRVDPGGCWTIMLTGRHVRDWGFYIDGTWKRMRRFFREHGHHPCED